MYKTQKKQSLNLQKSLSNVAQQMDLYAQPIQLRINKNDKFTTPLGIVFSLGLMTVCGILGINNIYDVISKTSPSVVSSQDQQKETQLFILSPQNYTFVFSTTNLLVQNIYGLGIYYNVTMQNCYRKKVSQNVTLTCETYLFEQCTKNHFQADYQSSYFQNFNISNMMCINYEQWTKIPLKLQGNPSSDNYYYLRPQMTRCKGDTCVTKDILISKLPAGLAQFYVQDQLVDLRTPGNPFQPIIKTFMIIFSMSSMKTYQHQYQVANVHTDNGLFIEDIETKTSLLSYQERESSESSDGVTFIDYAINIDARQINYKRTYDKVQDIVGNIGGLWQALYFACLIIIMPFIQSLLELNLINKFFTFSYKVEDVNQSASMNRSKSVLNSPPMQKSTFISKSLKNHKSFKVLNISGVSDIAKYLKEKKHDLEIGIGDICWFMMGKKKKEKQQFAYGVQKILKKLDIVYIMQKLFEIDKLKMVLLNDRQLKLFNYFPKPCIPESLFNKIDNEEQSQYLRQQEQQTQFAYILKEEETQEKKIEEAYKAYKQLKMTKGTDKDERILQHLDQDLINLFDYLYEAEPRPDSISEELAQEDEQEQVESHQANFESEYKTYQKPRIINQ